MAIIWNDLQKVTLPPRTPKTVTMQGALGPGLSDGCEMLTGGKGLGIKYTTPEDRPLRGPFTTGCDQPDAICYEAFMQKFKADQVVEVLMQQECIPPLMLRSVSVYGTFPHASAVLTDGTVIFVKDDDYEPNRDIFLCSEWTGMVKTISKLVNVVGLREDGTVMAIGFNWDRETAQQRAAAFENCVDISTYSDKLIGIRADGSVQYTDVHPSGDGNYYGYRAQCDALENVKKGCVDKNHMLFLHHDGSVTALASTGFTHVCVSDVASWSGTFVDIAVNGDASVGLRDDGTLVGAGEGVGDYTSWTDIVAIAGHTSSYQSLTALRADGVVLHRYEAGHVVERDDWPGVVEVDNAGGIFVGRTPCKVYTGGLNEYKESLRANMESMFNYCL